MTRIEEYRLALGALADWEPYLREHSGLPGPRGNLELAHATADLGREEQFLRWAALAAEEAPENTPEAFVAFCGVLGLGELLRRTAGHESPVPNPAPTRIALLRLLRAAANDPRWRIREAVATGLQRWGDADMPGLQAEMTGWAEGSRLEQRAAVAALCEPRLLKSQVHASAVLSLLDRITATVVAAHDRKTEDFRVLRQALGYAWSVAVVALPGEGKPLIERWLASDNPDIRWIMRENLGKKRLSALDPAWVAAQGADRASA